MASDSSKRNFTLITAGDSNMTSVGPAAFTPTNSSVIDNLSIYDGAIYAAADPLLGHTLSPLGNGGIAAQLADKFVPAFDRVICAPCAVGGSTTAMWAAGGVLYNRLAVTIKRLAARGITPLNCTFALIYQIGANEHGVTSAAFQANVAQTVAKAKDAGFNGRIFIPIYSIISNAADATRVVALATDAHGQTALAGDRNDTRFWRI